MENSTFHRSEHDREHPYCVVSRALIRDKSISPECRWLIIYLLANRDDWKIHIREIINHCKGYMGRDKVYEVVKEAINAGYMEREDFLVKGMTRTRYNVSEEPIFKKCLLRPENQDTENQDTENTDAKGLASSNDYQKEEYKEDPKPETTGKSASPPSADAEALYDFFLERIRERNPEFKEPNRLKWAKEFDCLLKIDKRDLLKTKTLILWASTHKWWAKACLSPSKLRKEYDVMLIDAKVDDEQDLVRANRAYALQMKEKHPKELKAMSFDSKYVMNSSTAKEIPFNLPLETFEEGLITMFGGEYVPCRG